MKYTIFINQFALFTAGLVGKIDYTDIAMLEYMKDFVFFPKRVSIWVAEGQGRTEYIWLNYKHMIESLPFANIKSKSAIGRRLAKLRMLGLIRTYVSNNNTLYYTLTEKMIDLLFYKRDIQRIEKNKGQKQQPPEQKESAGERKLYAPRIAKNEGGYATLSNNVDKVIALIRERATANAMGNKQ